MNQERKMLKYSLFSSFIYLFIFLLYHIVLVLPYIDMNPPWVYMLVMAAFPKATFLSAFDFFFLVEMSSFQVFAVASPQSPSVSQVQKLGQP